MRGEEETHTLLHLGDQLLVEETLGLLMERAVDGDNVALSEHVLELVDTTAANLGLLLGRQGLVVEVEEFLAVECLQSAEDTLTDTANGDGTDDLVLEIVLVLCDGGDVPVTLGDHLVGGSVVADEDEHGHDDVLGDGNNIGASDLSNSDTAIGLVGGVQVNVVGTDTSSDGNLQVLCLGQTLCGEVAGVERSGDDDLGINKVLVESRVCTVLVRGGDELVALVLDPLAQTELVLSGTEQLRLVLCVLETIVQNHQHLAVLAGSR